MSRTYPAARAFVLGDAGNGVITDDFLHNELAHWNFDPHMPRFIPALDKPFSEIKSEDIWPAGAEYFTNARFAQYTSAFDGGGGGQTQFYQVMLNPTNVRSLATVVAGELRLARQHARTGARQCGRGSE